MSVKDSYIKWYISCQDSFRTFIKENPKNTLSIVFEQNSIKYKSTILHDKVKYSDDCTFEHPWQLACRGTVITPSQIIFCLNKFFNEHEIKQRLGVSFQDLLTSLSTTDHEFFFMPKWDGTCMQVFSDGERIYAYTLGSLDPNCQNARISTGKSIFFINVFTIN